MWRLKALFLYIEKAIDFTIVMRLYTIFPFLNALLRFFHFVLSKTVRIKYILTTYMHLGLSDNRYS